MYVMDSLLENMQANGTNTTQIMITMIIIMKIITRWIWKKSHKNLVEEK